MLYELYITSVHLTVSASGPASEARSSRARRWTTGECGEGELQLGAHVALLFGSPNDDPPTRTRSFHTRSRRAHALRLPGQHAISRFLDPDRAGTRPASKAATGAPRRLLPPPRLPRVCTRIVRRRGHIPPVQSKFTSVEAAQDRNVARGPTRWVRQGWDAAWVGRKRASDTVSSAPCRPRALSARQSRPDADAMFLVPAGC